MGWLWFIPAFHVLASDVSSVQPKETTKLVLTRKEIDFALGVGSAIVDVEISMEWLKETDTEEVALLDSEGEKKQDLEPTSITATVD